MHYTWLHDALQPLDEKQIVNTSIDFNWKLALFSGFFFILFVNLGLWQLERAAEKEDLITEEANRRNQPPVLFNELPRDAHHLSGTVVRLKGEYVPGRIFLLDNRVLKGKVGFEVLVPYRESGGVLALVNRGFVPMGRTREETPVIPSLITSTFAAGSLYISVENRFIAEEENIEVANWPRIVQTGDPLVLQQLIGEDFYPHIFRLTESDPNALPRFWPTTIMLPVKHKGYALQWFTMALVIAMAFTFFTFRQNDD
jgi:cytochrome oxidase assembly protein ShyY1